MDTLTEKEKTYLQEFISSHSCCPDDFTANTKSINTILLQTFADINATHLEAAFSCISIAASLTKELCMEDEMAIALFKSLLSNTPGKVRQ